MKFAIIGGILTLMCFAWVLCRAASLADQRMEEDCERT